MNRAIKINAKGRSQTNGGFYLQTAHFFPIADPLSDKAIARGSAGFRLHVFDASLFNSAHLLVQESATHFNPTRTRHV